jgi:hypothetical protein
VSSSIPKAGQSLAEMFPVVASQWHPTRNGDLTANDVKPYSQKRVWWQCEKHSDHVFDAAIGNRVQGRGCPFCGGKKVLGGYNDLETLYPDVAAQWHPTFNKDLIPSQITAGSSFKAWWKCPVETDHEWQTSISLRTNPKQMTGCPMCAGRIVVKSTCLATLFPLIASQWHPIRNVGFTPKEVSPFVTKEAWWVCEHGHEWATTVASRTRGNGCPMCSGQAAIAGETDLATTHPELISEWHPTRNPGLDPGGMKAGTNKKVWWRCTLGHEWETSPVNRAMRNSGCPYCAGQRPIVGVNDLATSHPMLALEWHPTKNESLTPRDIMAGTDRKVWWLCSVDHEWAAPTYNRVNVQSGCPICMNKQVLSGFNDLQTTDPTLANEWHPTKNTDVRPTQVTRFSGKKVWWICKDGHKWPSTVANRSIGQGCPTCAHTGFDPNKEGWLYFLDNDQLDMFQIGISNVLEKRLNKHSRGGWEVIEVRGPMEGHLAQQLETAILHAIEKRGAVLGHKASIAKFDGYSEAWIKASLTVNSFKELLDFVYEDDQLQK